MGLVQDHQEIQKIVAVAHDNLVSIMGYGMGQHGFVKIPFGPFSLPTKVTHVFFVGYELVALSDSHIGKKFLCEIDFTNFFSLLLFQIISSFFRENT